MPEEGAPEDPAREAVGQPPAEIDEEHARAGPSPPSDAADPEPPVAGLRSAGPPADWLEKVRRHAPGLLASPTQRAAPPPVVPHRLTAATGQPAPPSVAADERATHGAGPPAPRTHRVAALQPPDETDDGPSRDIAAERPEPLELREDESPASSPVTPWPAMADGASGRGSAQPLTDQAGEAWNRAEKAPEPVPEPAHQADPRPATVDQSRLADPLTAAYQARPPADDFSPIAPVAGPQQGHEPALEAKPEPIVRGEPWPSPAPRRSPRADLDSWPTTPPANASVRAVGFADAASLVGSPTAETRAPIEAMPPAGPASRWPTLPPAGPAEDSFEAATALRSRDRWSRLVREQESA